MYALRRIWLGTAISASLAFFVSNPAYALSVSLQLGGNQSSPAVSETAASFSGMTGYQAGLGIHMGLAGPFGLELGAVYAYRQFEQQGTISGTPATQTFSHYAVQAPLMITFSPASIITFGLGGFAEWGHGKVKVKTKLSTSTTTTSTDVTFGSAGLRPFNRGAIGMLRLNVINMAMSSLFIDGRYLYGITDVVHAEGFKLQHRDMQVMLGYRINFSK